MSIDFWRRLYQTGVVVARIALLTGLAIGAWYFLGVQGLGGDPAFWAGAMSIVLIVQITAITVAVVSSFMFHFRQQIEWR